ncbi:hypothetical protein [Viridibacillus sp. FSL H7-0596]|uniref:DUF6906 family protein n=1 Tax=Viridibacillus sp. FSL H7-0596 TaxID=1928923 RepID=UPI00143917D2|nr:hypothetical protein [Viridibacillus sp. FSL H7-0596]
MSSTKNGKRLTVAEREHLQALKINSENWLMSKKQSNIWTLVHRNTNQAKQVLAP